MLLFEFRQIILIIGIEWTVSSIYLLLVLIHYIFSRLRLLAESKGFRLDDTGLFPATQSPGGKRVRLQSLPVAYSISHIELHYYIVSSAIAVHFHLVLLSYVGEQGQCKFEV